MKCDYCNGKGIRKYPFWHQRENERGEKTSSQVTSKCIACNGTGQL